GEAAAGSDCSSAGSISSSASIYSGYTGSRINSSKGKKGVEEAVEAGKRISNIPIDMIYTSALIRAQMTAMLAMTQHRRKKVPIVLHNESEQAQSWSQIFSQDTEKQCIPVVTAWQLNERM
nr:histidine phosphatase superfamily, clade-1 [Tanacetum cinerariifolium]